MDFSLQSHKSFIGLPATELPTPSLVLSKPVIENNIQQLLDDVKHLNIAFRPHVKTLKVLPYKPHSNTKLIIVLVNRSNPHDAR